MTKTLPELSTPARIRGRLLVVAAAVLWSTSGLFAHAPCFDDWPALEHGIPVRGVMLAFWRALFAGLVLLPLVRRPCLTVRLVPMIGAFVVMNVVFLAAMVLTTPANAIWLQYTAPLYVFVVGVFFLGEKAGAGDWLRMLFVVLGLGTILAFELGGQQAAGVVYGVLSGVTFAVVVLSLRLLRDRDSAWLVSLNLLLTAACLFPFVAWRGIWPSPRQLLVLAAFGALQMGIPYFLFARGVRSILGHEASALALLEPLLVPLWVFLAWGEATRWWTFVGGGLILFGLLLRYAPRVDLARRRA